MKLPEVKKVYYFNGKYNSPEIRWHWVEGKKLPYTEYIEITFLDIEKWVQKGITVEIVKSSLN